MNSDDVQNELSDLGVSVYDQLEFETGVLKQIDTEVQRMTAEQDKQFLLKEYDSIKGEIKLAVLKNWATVKPEVLLAKVYSVLERFVTSNYFCFYSTCLFVKR